MTDMRYVEESGVKLLGCPVGSRELVEQFFRDKIEKVKTITAELSSLHVLHVVGCNSKIWLNF